MRKKPLKKILKDHYSFSLTDNDVKKELISPNKFLRITFAENQRKTKPKRDWEIFQERYLKRKIQYKTAVYKNQKEYEKRVLNPENVKAIKEIIQGKKDKYGIPIPFLEFDVKGDPIGHEGRHTARALKELGYKKIPYTKVVKKW